MKVNNKGICTYTTREIVDLINSSIRCAENNFTNLLTRTAVIGAFECLRKYFINMQLATNTTIARHE